MYHNSRHQGIPQSSGAHLDASPLTESWADVEAVPALKVTMQVSLTDSSFSRSRWRRPFSNDTISALGDSLTGLPLRSQRQSLLSGRERAHSNSASPPLKVSTFSRPWTMVMGFAVTRIKMSIKREFIRPQCSTPLNDFLGGSKWQGSFSHQGS